MHMISLVKSLKFLPFQTRFTSLSLHFLNINASKFYNDPSLRWHSSPSSSLYPTLSTPTSSSDQPSPPSQKKKSDLTMQEHYEFYLKTHHFESDLKQMNAISYFENLRTQLIQRRIQFDLDTQKKNKHTLGYLFKWFSFGTSQFQYQPLKGIYLYGSVGSGKTMLMDLFYNALPDLIQRKRTHFHSFMLDMHTKSHEFKQRHLDRQHNLNPYSLYIQNISKTTELICLDEFQVLHITDAMILRKLLEEFIQLGVVFVLTSNRHPSELYLNGLQRASFVPCIEFLQNNTHVINLSSKSDYRNIDGPRFRIFLYPQSYAKSKLNQLKLILGTFQPYTLTHSYHSLPISHIPHRASLLTFQALCENPVSVQLYQRLVELYPIIIIDAFPTLSLHMDRNSIRRWITFVDIAYEAQTQCILHTSTSFHNILSIDSIYEELQDEEKFAWNRMLSRMLEMQKDTWVTDPDLRRVLDKVE